MGASFDNSSRTDYQFVAASLTNQVLAGQKGSGGSGDLIDKLIIIPLTLAAGDVSLTDGLGAAMKVFATGTLADLKPHVIVLGARSTSGAWKITTGANVTVMAVGRFQ